MDVIPRKVLNLIFQPSLKAAISLYFHTKHYALQWLAELTAHHKHMFAQTCICNAMLGK